MDLEIFYDYLFMIDGLFRICERENSPPQSNLFLQRVVWSLFGKQYD